MFRILSVFRFVSFRFVSQISVNLGLNFSYRIPDFLFRISDSVFRIANSGFRVLSKPHNGDYNPSLALALQFVTLNSKWRLVIKAIPLLYSAVLSSDITAAMFVYPTNPPGIELYYRANVFFCLV